MLWNVRGNEIVFNQSRNKGDITVDICGVSTPAVYRIRAGNSEDKGDVVKGRPRIVFDDFDKRGLSRLILGFYTRIPPELPTVDKIYAE